MSSSDLRLFLGGSAGRLAIAGDLGEHVRLAEDQVILGADLDLGPAVLGEDDLVALRQVHRDELSVVVPGARADGEDAAALRLLLRGIRKHDAARRRLLLFEDLDDEAVTKRLQVHAEPPLTALSDISWHSPLESAGSILRSALQPRKCQPSALVS